MILETERLILRSPTMKDVDDLIKNISDLKISKWLLVVAYPYTKEDAEWWINHCEEKGEKNYEFNIELKSSGELIGGVGLSNIKEEQGTADIGYWLGTGHQRKGIMSEAVKAVLDLAFNKLKLRRLEAPIFAGNEPSQGLAKSLGFIYEGTKRKAAICKATGEIHDEVVYSLLVEDYKN